MSLLDSGPDEVLVWPETEIVDERRNRIRVPSGDPTSVRGRVQPLSSSDTDEQQTDTLRRLITREFPGGPWARVSWGGRDWDVVGEPEPHNGSPRTRHHTVTLRARNLSGGA